jgi:hypothetical protein
MESFRYWLYRHGFVRLISAEGCCMGLTTIRLQPAIYFLLHREECPVKGGKMASAFTVQ